MKRTEWLQETRKMRFGEAYKGCKSGRLTQAEAGQLLGVCDRTFWCFRQITANGNYQLNIEESRKKQIAI